MTSKKTIIVAQVFISGMMAFLMTGFFSFLSLGPTSEWLHAWPRAYVIAWPVAFCFSLIVGPVAFKLAHRVVRIERP